MKFKLPDPILKYFQPRSTDPEVAFRERTIRITVVLLILLLTLAILTNLLIFQDFKRGEYSYLLFMIVTDVLMIASLVALEQKKVLVSGWILAVAFVEILVSLTLINGYWDVKIGPALMLALLVTALALPRRVLWPFGVTVFALLTIVSMVQASNGYRPDYYRVGYSVGVSTFLLPTFFEVVAELIFLSGIQGEFESRMTALRAANLDLDKAAKEAQSANRLKSQFLANMSHELRTPLNAIIGYAEIMLNGMAGEIVDSQKKLIGYMHTNGRRLLSLINDILDLAKIESGTVDLVLTPESPRKLITDLLDTMQSLAQNKSIYLKAEFKEDVPERVLCDNKRLSQVITNLVSNAIKFTETGGVTVAVDSTEDFKNWRIQVRDSGRGMPQEAIAYIFEVFRQVDGSDSREKQGTGLGLAITKQLVDRMGGYIEVTTEMGKGSTFSVTLPRMSGALRKEEKEEEKALVAA
jgi:signal transduction histidine kinase